MRLLELILEEYLHMVEVLEKKETIKNNRIVIDREYFKKLLEKYPYITFKNKTKIYKGLNLIIHDKNNYTMPYKDPILKKTVRKVIINYATYQLVKHYYERQVE